MADLRYISLKIYGNPEANGGFMPLCLFNSPAFDIVDAFYTGYDANSYFFSVKVEKMQVVYKLMKNNVRSYNSNRAGSLVIGFSIPRGYKLEQGYDPFDVIMALKDKFLATSMTCRDKANETYEFNSGSIDATAIEETARQFTLTPGASPYYPMTEGGPVGCITCPEEQIEQLLKDIQCRNLSKFSEVVIAETASATNKYTPITGLLIPRVPEYIIMVDGVKKGVITDTKKTITIKSEKSPLYYDLSEQTFTIEQLLNRDRIENVTLDEETETVYISTTALATRKTKRIQILFLNNAQEKYFFANKNFCRLTHQGRIIALNDNFTFTLAGEDIAILSNPAAFRFECDKSDKYTVTGLEYRAGDDKMTVKAAEVINTMAWYPGGQDGGAVKPTEATDIILHFNNLDFFKGENMLKVRVGREDKNANPHMHTTVRLSQQQVKGKRAEYVGHVYIPSDWNKHSLYLKVATPDRKTAFITPSPIRIKNNVAEVGINDLMEDNPSKLKMFFKSNKLLTGILSGLLCCLLGAGIGFLLHDTIAKSLSKKGGDTKTVTTGDNKEGDVKENPTENDNNTFVTTPTITDDDAKANLETIKTALSQEDLTFAQVDEICKLFNANKEQYERLDKPTCELIERYKDVVEDIKNGDLDDLKKYLNDATPDKQLKYKHHLMLHEAFIAKGDNKYSKAQKKIAEEYFMTNYTTYKSFKDLAIPNGLLNTQNQIQTTGESTSQNSNSVKKATGGGNKGGNGKSGGGVSSHGER